MGGEAARFSQDKKGPTAAGPVIQQAEIVFI
jgi:hypothetical protein